MCQERARTIIYETGFSVIELVIVLAVVMIIGVIIIPYGSAERRYIRNAAVTMQADIRYAQRMAITEGKRYQVKFNELLNKYTVQYEIAGTIHYKVTKEVFLQDGVSIKSVNTDFVEYGPKGTNNKAFTLVLQNDTYSISLTANIGAGRIAIKDMVKR